MPYLNTINISSQGYEVINNFNQNLSQYNSAVMPVYDAINNRMTTVFFGGMSMYQLDTLNNTLITDTLIPFVNTISKVVRSADSSLTEYANPASMPALTGTNSIFIPSNSISVMNGIVDLNALPYGVSLVGTIIGGINSDHPNVSNNPDSSHAENTTYRVYLNKFMDTKAHDIEVKNDIVNLLAYPNPADRCINILFEIQHSCKTKISVINYQGKPIQVLGNSFLNEGKYVMKWTAPASGIYFVKVQTDKYAKSVKFLVN
jgi:hypothetical protein